MFERFTEHARQVVVVAQQEARDLNHNYIGTEHILLGLMSDEHGGLAAQVLESLGIGREEVRREVVRIVGRGEEAASGQIPFTPRAKKVLELALREAMGLNHNYIGTEHILLGLSDEKQGVAARVLHDCGAAAERIRSEVIRELGVSGSAQHPPASIAAGSSAGGWLDGVRPLLGQLSLEIRRELGRDPDPGDLLLVLASVGSGLPARALAEMGVDLDALWGNVERLRQSDQRGRNELEQEIEELAAEKQRALDEQRLEAAAELRDRERELRERSRPATSPPAEFLPEIRRRLGIPVQPAE